MASARVAAQLRSHVAVGRRPFQLIGARAEGSPAHAEKAKSYEGMRRVPSKENQMRWEATLHTLYRLQLWSVQ